MADFKVIASYPAWDIVDRGTDEDGVTELELGEVVALSPKHYERFRVSGAGHYAAQYQEDPQAAVERCRSRGEPIYWMVPQAASLTAEARAKTFHQEVRVGMVIRLDGHLFRIDSAPNRNLKLTELED